MKSLNSEQVTMKNAPFKGLFNADSAKTDEEREDYKQFHEFQQSTLSLLMFTLLGAVVLCTFICAKLYYTVTASSLGSLTTINVFALSFEFVLLLTLLLLSAVKLSIWGLSQEFRNQARKSLQIIFIAVCTVYISILLNAKVRYGECAGNRDTIALFYCNGRGFGLPTDMLMALTLIPMAFYFVARDTRVEIVMISWMVGIAALCATMTHLTYWSVLGPLFIYIFGTFMIYYETHRRHLTVYFLTRKLQTTLMDNERLADETHANEMRAMIANVAHDLKTPLTSFLSGIDFISHLLEDCEESMCCQPTGPTAANGAKVYRDQLAPMRDCLDSILNTNAFMVMTINRCIDYTKASKGMKLVPKLETIDLRETLELPLKVMRDMQQRIEITLDDGALQFNDKLCSHIITDKQWLQENLLCLLSNAVKYSSKGKVDITVALIKEALVRKKSKYHMRKFKAMGTVVSKVGLSSERAATSKEKRKPNVKSSSVVNDLLPLPESPSIMSVTVAKMLTTRIALSRVKIAAAHAEGNGGGEEGGGVGAESTGASRADGSSSSDRGGRGGNDLNADLEAGAGESLDGRGDNDNSDRGSGSGSGSPSQHCHHHNYRRSSITDTFRRAIRGTVSARAFSTKTHRAAEASSFGLGSSSSVELFHKATMGQSSDDNSGSGSGSGSGQHQQQKAIPRNDSRMLLTANLFSPAFAAVSVQNGVESEDEEQYDDDDDEDDDDGGGEVKPFQPSDTAPAPPSAAPAKSFARAISRVMYGMHESKQASSSGMHKAPSMRKGVSRVAFRNESPTLPTNTAAVSALDKKEGDNEDENDNGDKETKENTVEGTRNKTHPPDSIQNEDSGRDIPMVLKFEVQDTGIGLSEEAMKNLFNPFKQAQRLAGGTGLGLYSLAKRMDALKGYYGVEKRKDGKQGSLFWFAVPYRPDRVSAAMFQRSRARIKQQLLQQSSFGGSDIVKAVSKSASPSPMKTFAPPPAYAPSFHGGTSSVTSKLGSPAPVSMPVAGQEAPGVVATTEGQRPMTHHEQRLDDIEEQIRALSSNPSALDVKSIATVTTTAATATVNTRVSTSSSPTTGDIVVPMPSPSTASAPNAAAPLEHMNVLLVDDAISILKMTSMMLKRQGHIITQAENGAEALEKILDHYSEKGKSFDVVIMDLQMPVMDGLEAVRRLRAEEEHKSAKLTVSDFGRGIDSCPRRSAKTKVTFEFNDAQQFTHSVKTTSRWNKLHQLVIGCSANSDHETMQEALKAGVDAFMAKPFSMDTFYDILRQFKQPD